MSVNDYFSFSFCTFIRVVKHRERLDVDPSKSFVVNLAKIYNAKEDQTTRRPVQLTRTSGSLEKPVSDGFVDDPDVPPLI